MQNYNEIWKAALVEMKNEYSDAFINLWFAETELAAITDTVAIIIIPSNFKRKMLEDKYPHIIDKYLKIILGYDIEPVILSSENGRPDLTPYIGIVTESNDVPETPKHTKEPIREPENGSDNVITLNTGDTRKRFTFDNFLVGSSNRFAHAAALAVANSPAEAYNPLFIYGASGLGKTHLLYAIINRILENDPDAKIIYVTGEDFTNQLIRSLANKDMESFRDKFRNCSVLLIDDIQFIAGKVSTQEEFFHTFNALYEENKQIILTSDRPAKDISPLEDRIRTRFEWGLQADVQPPNIELRIAIMRDKAQKMNIVIPDDAYVYLAENLKNNVRQLEGALKKIAAKSYLESSPITFELVKESVSDMIRGMPSASVTVDRILNVVAQKYGIEVEDLKSKKKTAQVVLPRHISVYLVRTMTDLSLARIGMIFHKDHTTIMNSIKNIENEIKNNSGCESEINDLIDEITNISTTQ